MGHEVMRFEGKRLGEFEAQAVATSIYPAEAALP